VGWISSYSIISPTFCYYQSNVRDEITISNLKMTCLSFSSRIHYLIVFSPIISFPLFRLNLNCLNLKMFCFCGLCKFKIILFLWIVNMKFHLLYITIYCHHILYMMFAFFLHVWILSIKFALYFAAHVNKYKICWLFCYLFKAKC